MGRVLLSLSLLFSLFSFGQEAEVAVNELEENNIYDAVVRIEVATKEADYSRPWSPGNFQGGIGTGFLIKGGLIMTNAHVASSAQRIMVTRRNSARKLPAHVVHIAHDCDLAILQVEDPKALADVTPLEFGTSTPKLESEVRAIGYPIGGERLSVTRGVVSRIDFRPYAHSRIDSHLIIQIDAAINPGNSGGPVIQDGKVVGVAFQGLTQADNTGYIIPFPVVKRFLTDIEDGKYDHYVDLGIIDFPMHSPAMRTALKLPDEGLGVLVAAITPGGPCEGHLEAGDILLSIDGNPVDYAGNIKLDGEQLLLHEVVERKFAGDTVELEYQRDGTISKVNITLKPFEHSRIHAIKYGARPRYIFYAGLLFQPLDYNLYATYRWESSRLRTLFNNYIKDGIFQERKDIVVLSRIESDRLTAHLGGYAGKILKSINGEKITSLQQVYELLYEENTEEYTIIECEGNSRPIIIPTAMVQQTNTRLMQANNFHETHYLKP